MSSAAVLNGEVAARRIQHVRLAMVLAVLPECYSIATRVEGMIMDPSARVIPQSSGIDTVILLASTALALYAWRLLGHCRRAGALAASAYFVLVLASSITGSIMAYLGILFALVGLALTARAWPVLRSAAALLLVALCAGSPLHAQATTPASAAAAPAPMRGPTEAQVFWFLQNMPVESGRTIGPLINALLSDTAAHMKMAERRRATHDDTVRAAGIVTAMRTALQPYIDVSAAERDGYQRFMPWLAEQQVYHYNSTSNSRDARLRFDAAKPTSLLYRKEPAGALVLIGAMYTAPGSSSLDELDARLPLGVAYWHQHVNFCARRPSPEEIRAQRPDSALVARALRIETREECAEAGGMFMPQLFGWMAHVNAFEGDAQDTIWGAEGREHMHMHGHHGP